MVEYFLTSVNKNDFLHYTKSRVLVYVCFVGALLVGMQLLSSFIIGFDESAFGRKVILPLSLLFLFLLDLVLLKLIKNKNLPGNFLVLSLLFVQFGFLFYYAQTAGLDYFVSGFYHAMIFFSLGAMFSSRNFILANTIFFLLALNVIIFFRMEPNITNPYMAELLTRGKFHFQMVFVIFAIIVVLIHTINKRAYFQISLYIREEEKESEKKKVLIRSIENVSMALTRTADAIRNESEKVSKGSNIQAAGIEQISASVEEASTALVEISDNAHQTKVLSDKTSRFIQQNLGYFQKTAALVESINKNSSEIDIIAAQTEVLAINAAIEASKTRGLHGGFTVIAAEIKKLAENTLRASENIFQFINKSYEMSQLSSQSITQINHSLLELNGKMEQVAFAAEEQKQSVYQISEVMNQLSNSAQENSALSNQLFEIAEKLKELSLLLKTQLQVR